MKLDAGHMPRLVFRMVGDDDFRSRAASILSETQVGHDWQGRDAGISDAFRSSVCADWPFLTDADFEQIDRHTNVLRFSSAPFACAQAADMCQRMLGLAARLLEADGWAMKCESSGVSHARETWLKLVSRARHSYRRFAHSIGTPRERLHDRVNYWTILYQTLVEAPVQVYSVYYTCGMHLLGQPELIVRDTDLAGTLEQALRMDRAAELFEAFAIHLLAESAPVGCHDDQAFRVGSDSDAFRVSLENSAAGDPDDCHHNPYGRWRFARIVAKHSSNGVAAKVGKPQTTK